VCRGHEGKAVLEGQNEYYKRDSVKATHGQGALREGSVFVSLQDGASPLSRYDSLSSCRTV